MVLDILLTFHEIKFGFQDRLHALITQKISLSQFKGIRSDDEYLF